MEVTKMITTKINNKILIIVLVILSVTAVPLLQNHQTAYANTPSSQVTVTAFDLNVREAADISSKIINLVHQGDTFEVIQTMNNWDEIKLLSNQTGWVYNGYLTPTEKIDATVKTFSLKAREYPNLSSHIVGYLKFGTKITIQSEQAGWANIVSPSGVSGWVNEYCITKDVPSNQQAQPVTSPPTSKTMTSHTSGKKSLPTSTNSSSSTEEKSSSPSTNLSSTLSEPQLMNQSIATDNLIQDNQ